MRKGHAWLGLICPLQGLEEDTKQSIVYIRRHWWTQPFDLLWWWVIWATSSVRSFHSNGWTSVHVRDMKEREQLDWTFSIGSCSLLEKKEWEMKQHSELNSLLVNFSCVLQHDQSHKVKDLPIKVKLDPISRRDGVISDWEWKTCVKHQKQNSREILWPREGNEQIIWKSNPLESPLTHVSLFEQGMSLNYLPTPSQLSMLWKLEK